MEKITFENNLKEIYNLSTKFDKDIAKFYNAINEKSENQEFIDNFLEQNNIKINSESRLAIISRIVNLKPDSLENYLKKENKTENERIEIQENAYILVKNFYEEKQLKLIQQIKEKKLTSNFYQVILEGFYKVGLKFNQMQPKWKKHIIQTINKDLEKEFKTQDQIMKYLTENNLFDLGHNKELADRSYSALVKNQNGKYESKAYSQVFKNEVEQLVEELINFKNSLNNLEDEIYNLKEEHINYIQSLINAFSETNVNLLVEKWADVDRAWMKTTSPFQIGHPLEYYEDHYRKAVALEWDIRFSNPNFAKNTRVTKIKKMHQKLFEEFGTSQTSQVSEGLGIVSKKNSLIEKYNSAYNYALQNLDNVQLYIGKPLLFAGDDLNGLFSAQVVPNDTIVSNEMGKKIFAFPDLILQSSRDRPFMKLGTIIFEKDFIKESRRFLFQETEKFYQCYDVETIGHEYGHILWQDETTEIEMNKTGNYKNIEEFKATTGGLVSFLLDEENNLQLDIIRDLITRAVGIIAWQQVDSTRPYYCEGLIHLTALFETKILNFNQQTKKLEVTLNQQTYEKIKTWYIKTYKQLALHYLNKKDASEFLYKYAKEDKTNPNIFYPTNQIIKEFVKYYYDKYKEFGNQIDTQDTKENYILNSKI